MTNSWKRQHPAVIFITFLSNLKQVIFTLIAVFIVGQSSNTFSTIFTLFFSAFILLSSLVSGLIFWWRFLYIVHEEELQIKQGLFFTKNRYIRRERIQSIDINAKLLQRLFGLVELRIETAGGQGEAEFKITALRQEEAEQIKAMLLRRGSKPVTDSLDAHPNEPLQHNDDDVYGPKEFKEQYSPAFVEEVQEEKREPSYTWDLSVKRLLIAAATSSGVGIAATFIAAVVSQAPSFLPEWLFEMALSRLFQSSLLLIGAFVVTVLALAWLFTFVSTLLKYGQFKVEKDDHDIHISRGVLEKRSLTINEKNITAVRIVQNLLREPFGFVSVYVESAGGGTKDEDQSTILLPLCKRSEVEGLLRELASDFAFTPSYEGLPKKSMRRYMIKLILIPTILAGIATYFLPYGYVSFLLPLAGAFIGYLQYKAAGITTETTYLCMRSRGIAKTDVYLPKKRIQTMDMSQHLLQKVDQLHTIHVSVLTTLSGKTFHLPHISDKQKERFFAWYSYENQTQHLESVDIDEERRSSE
ncbi:PH domain-containing protein [Paenalkalicoccus suaedae]|uniref:PH domain-containing protein n=1 Tax=Paenalkalicoccus suaedae TaxID=2592382 RepID=A0A859FFY8_9BACI|nr:PH domain-containing protein [Paenalkalicoccus suaedae]QKS71146.1 PH domain-containing protein [Paenalkalicoccus suaedae]